MQIYWRFEKHCFEIGPYLEFVAHTLNFYSIEIQQITLTRDLEENLRRRMEMIDP